METERRREEWCMKNIAIFHDAMPGALEQRLFFSLLVVWRSFGIRIRTRTLKIHYSINNSYSEIQSVCARCVCVYEPEPAQCIHFIFKQILPMNVSAESTETLITKHESVSERERGRALCTYGIAFIKHLNSNVTPHGNRCMKRSAEQTKLKYLYVYAVALYGCELRIAISIEIHSGFDAFAEMK